MQGKLKLNLDDLKVESFDTMPAGYAGGRGTVFGLSVQPDPSDPCEENTIDDPSCEGGCTNDCEGSALTHDPCMCWSGPTDGGCCDPTADPNDPQCGATGNCTEPYQPYTGCWQCG